jgi:hypothetical protein
VQEQIADGVNPRGRLLGCPDVQFWQTENGWGLDSSRRGGYRGDIPYLVDASDVRTVSSLKSRCGLVNE